MTLINYDVPYEDLSAWAGSLSKHYIPSGDSSFKGVTGNLLAIVGFGEQLEDPALVATKRALVHYLHLIEVDKEFRSAEMALPRGLFPDFFELGSSYPHTTYVQRAVAARTGEPL